MFVPVDPRYPKMYVLGIDDSLKDLGMKLGFNQFFLNNAPDSKYLTDGYIFRAEFIKWYESQNYPFCKLKGVEFELEEQKSEEEPYPFNVNDLDLTKRAIMEDHGFKTGYQTKLKPEVLKKEEAAIKKAREKSLKNNRVDLADLPTFTIDGKKTRCRDDAMSWEMDGDVWKLYVHIADISETLPANSKIDADAKEKLMSTYIGDFIRPMLPNFITYQLGSL